MKSEDGNWRAFRSFLAEGRAVMPCNRRHLVTWWPCIRCSTGLSSLLISIFVNRINESSEKRWVQMSYRDDNIAFTRWKWSFHRMDRQSMSACNLYPGVVELWWIVWDQVTWKWGWHSRLSPPADECLKWTSSFLYAWMQHYDWLDWWWRTKKITTSHDHRVYHFQRCYTKTHEAHVGRARWQHVRIIVQL